MSKPVMIVAVGSVCSKYLIIRLWVLTLPSARLVSLLILSSQYCVVKQVPHGRCHTTDFSSKKSGCLAVQINMWKTGLISENRLGLF